MSFADVWIGWLKAKKRRSRHLNEDKAFATRRDRQYYDRQFLQSRERKRKHEDARRAKAIRD